MIVGRQFQTLPMFMTPNEIKSQVDTFDRRTHPDGTTESHEQMWNRKLDESRSFDYRSSGGRTLEQSIQHEGVRNPPLLEHIHSNNENGTAVFISDGHHRIAAHAAVHGPDTLMPVRHGDQGTIEAHNKLRAEHRAAQQAKAAARPRPPQTSSDKRRVDNIMSALGL